MLLLLLSACSEKEKVIKIEDNDKAAMLFIQKVEGNSSSEEMTKIVKNKQKIDKLFSMIEGIKVKETSNEYAFKQMKSMTTYVFVFSEDKEIESGKKAPYAFYALEDGSFIFSYSDFGVHTEPFITIEKHKQLLKEIKRVLEIEF